MFICHQPFIYGAYFTVQLASDGCCLVKHYELTQMLVLQWIYSGDIQTDIQKRIYRNGYTETDIQDIHK